MAFFFSVFEPIDFPSLMMPCRFSLNNMPLFGLGPSSKGHESSLWLSSNKISLFHWTLDLGSLFKVALSNLSNLKFCQKKGAENWSWLVSDFPLKSYEVCFFCQVSFLLGTSWSTWPRRLTAPRMTTLTLGKMNERSPPSHGRGEGAFREKTRCNQQPECTQRKHVNTSFSGRGWRKIHISRTKRWNHPLERNIKEEKKTPKMVFLMANFCPFVNFQIKKENIF